MSFINLPADASCGVPALDALHRSCRDAISIASRARNSEFIRGFESLLHQLTHAFRTEDQWMEEIDYLALKSHREQHARVLGAMHQIHSKVMQGDVSLGRHVVDDLLPQWLALHIDTMDNVLAIALCIDERGPVITSAQPCSAAA